jgi:hypothetical protein
MWRFDEMENNHAATEKESVKRAHLALLAIALLIMPVLGQTPQKIASINKKVVGKWVSADRKSYIEFFANGSCADGELSPDGKWQVDQNTLGAWEKGEDFSCGSGALTLIGPNALIRDYGMGGEPEKFYRGSANLPKPAGALTLGIAQAVLNRQIDLPTANNTLFTCHACYDPSDKGDNDQAPLVTTYSAGLTDYLIRLGYVRTIGDKQVFTAKAKRSRYYTLDQDLAGLRFTSFRNARILTTTIADPHHIPIEYELVPTEITAGFFGKSHVVKSFASFSYENEAWRVSRAE